MCMTNLNSGGRLLVVAVLCVFLIHAADCGGAGGGGAEVQWQILTKLNYSSAIRLHPHLLLLVTVPWSGESRSLMKELANAVANDDVRYGDLKLMVLYKNGERALADALGATDEITIFYHHNSLSYKYRGRYRVQNILASVRYVMSSSPDELPFKSLTTPEELKDFLNSTDKAVFLLEFCGWTPRLLGKNMTLTLGKGSLRAGFNQNNNGPLVGEEKDNVKGMESEELSCGIDNGFSGISLTDQFTSTNNSLLKETEDAKFTIGDLCSLHEFEQFEVFFDKLATVAREFFLPPERIKFAVVRESTLLPLLHIHEPLSWLMTLHVSGCPSCSKILKEVDDLRSVLQTRFSPVLEAKDSEITLPAKRPALLLFVDRSSNSMQIRRESQEALEAFKELAQHTEALKQIHGQATVRPDRTSSESNEGSSSALKHPRLQPFSSSQKLIIQDKMSVMVMNDGQQFTLESLVPDMQSSSMQEILNYVLNQKKRLTLSSLAKDKGFQLLSKDFDVEVDESVPSPSEDPSSQGLGEPVAGGDKTVDEGKQQTDPVSSPTLHRELPDSSDFEHPTLDSQEESSDVKLLSSVEPELAQDSLNDGETKNSEVEENEHQGYYSGSFFVCDGQYGFLETLTGGLKIPSIVMIDPISQQHYVLAEQSTLSYSSLSAFVDDFLNGRLHPYIKSSAIVPTSRDGMRPPFVNLNFRETDSIPLITPRTFPELVLKNKSDLKNSDHFQDRNVLVLFSNSWCGFCQRMELVVREVYRAVKTYTSTKINIPRKDELMPRGEYVEDASSKLPLIYMMDCTQNDCSSIIKSFGQRELYPLLLLFPKDRKNNAVPYEGDIAVTDIIKFLAAHGSHALDLIMDKNLQQDENSVEQSTHIGASHHQVLLKERLENKYQINAQLPVSLHERPQLFPGHILTASEKLQDAHPFDYSKILIFKADQTAGFQGLIFNKHISWDSTEEFVQGYELLKEAPLSFGGPVVQRGVPLVALTRRFIEGQSVEVLPNVYFLDQSVIDDVVEEIRGGKLSALDYWFFLGYSSWGWEQMFLEISQGAWNVSQGSIELLEWPS
ncbi:uncharacterized protein LOC127241265 isoform X2 [Andrographis paniculata]|uniref:uncharacterized protein LOC127241265 isoform X2 n=1 Tax=Andrographis paniculata TaxID=175694 RepID=UPI0021E8E0D6|nr:uncharacterized protein LOC127241265 isoform X2 [Andrographis paniculata]